MKYAIPSLTFLLFGCLIWLSILQGCRDQYADELHPRDASQIEGLWRGENSPYWYYHFSDGKMHQSIFEFNVANLVERYYGYSTHVDTVFLRDMHGDFDRVWIVYFDNDSTATVREPGPLQTVFTIKKF